MKHLAIAKQVEEAALSNLGAEPTPASGSTRAKGDGDLRVRGVPAYKLEVKATVGGKSVSVGREVLLKIAHEALLAGVDPALVIVFADERGKINPRLGEWVAVPRDVFLEKCT